MIMKWHQGKTGLRNLGFYESTNTPDFTRDRTVIADQRDIFSMQFTREIEGVLYKITNVFLKRDGKFWRYQVNRVPI